MVQGLFELSIVSDFWFLGLNFLPYSLNSVSTHV